MLFVEKCHKRLDGASVGKCLLRLWLTSRKTEQGPSCFRFGIRLVVLAKEPDKWCDATL